MPRSLFMNFAGTLVVAFVLGTSFIAFALYVIGRSAIEPNVVHTAENIQDTARIYRDKFGVPHLIAANEHDLFFTLGYVHAQDRLWQMDMSRRAGRGTLAEVLGEESVEADQFMRYIGLPEIASAMVNHASPATRAVLHAYASGVNFYISSHKNSLPFEFGALQYEPAPWTPEDCLIILRKTALDMSPSFWSDVIFGDIADNAGVARALELIPSYPVDSPTVADDKPTSHSIRPATAPVLADSLRREGISHILPQTGTMLSGVAGVFSTVRKQLGNVGSAVGSNCWAMKKYAADSGAAVLACDPHQPLGLPARWYQAHATAHNWNVTGLTIPGIPLFFVGRNDSVAWGYSAMMLDDADFFLEKVDPKNQNYYTDEAGTRQKFRYRRDTILVRNGEPIIYDIRYARRSSVISDVHLMKNQRRALRYKAAPAANAFLERYCLTYSWTGAEPSDELLGMYRINRAATWNDFAEGANVWRVPGLNLTFCDHAGNIGVAPSGAIPVRQKCSPSVPNPAWIPGYSWNGMIAPASLPRIINPQRRFVASANNPTAHTLPDFVSDLWEPPSRAERIAEALSQYDDYDIRDAQFLQMDITSPFARKIMARTTRILSDKRQYLSPEDKAVLAAMKKWDGLMSSRAAEPAVFAAFFDELLRHTFADELGERLYRQYMLVSSLPTRKIAELLADSNSVWFDNVTTPDKEDRNEIVFRSFVASLRRLRQHFAGKSFAEWQYGSMHQLTLYHQFSNNPYIHPIVTQGPMPTGGSNTTLNLGEWRFTEPFAQITGASMRFIADMSDTISYSIVPGGVSGEPLSAHYSDQLQLWLNGGYIPMSAGRAPTQGTVMYETLAPQKNSGK